MGIEPTQPAWKAGALPLSYTRVQFTVHAAKANMGGAGFEPAKAVPPDLQSGPFGRLGIHPADATSTPRSDPRRVGFWGPSSVSSVATGGRLPPDRAGGESRTHNRRFTKPVLCRLSYASDQQAK